MVSTLIKSYADRSISFLERFSQGRYWLVKAAVALTFISLFFAFPDYRHVIHEARDHKGQLGFGGHVDILDMVNRQVNNPLYVVPDMGGLQPEKHQFRITMPVIGYVFHIDGVGLIVLQHVFGIFIFVLVIMLAARISADRVLGLLTGLAFAFIYIGQACFIDLWPWFDGAAYFFLLIAMVSRKPAVIFISLLLAAFTDERALIASSLVFVWLKMLENENRPLQIKQFLLPAWRSAMVLLMWAVYFALRVFLTRQYGFRTHTGFMSGKDASYLWTYQQFGYGILSSLKFFWLFIISGLLVLLRLKKYTAAFAMAFCIIVTLAVALDVHDVTKSSAYAFPAIFISLYVFVKSGEPVKNLRYLVLTLALFCFVLPTLNIYGGLPYLVKPFFIEWFHD